MSEEKCKILEEITLCRMDSLIDSTIRSTYHTLGAIAHHLRSRKVFELAPLTPMQEIHLDISSYIEKQIQKAKEQCLIL